MPLTVLRDGAAPVILSNKTVFDQLPADTDVAELMSSIRAGDTVPVILRDIGAVALTSPGMVPALGYDPQSSLALLPVVADRAFEFECQILIPIDAIVNCRAPNRRVAEKMVEDIFVGLGSQPPDFTVQVHREELGETFHRIESGLKRSTVSAIGAYAVLISHAAER